MRVLMTRSLTWIIWLLCLGSSAQASRGDPQLAPGAHEIDLGEIRLHYVVKGQGPLLFVTSPGWGVGSLYLQSGLEPLTGDLTLLFIDTRGSGGSTRALDAGHMSRANMADDIEALRRKLDLPTVNLLGHSDGGAIGIEYAVRYPSRVRKLILVETAVRGDRDHGTTEALVQLLFPSRRQVRREHVAMQFPAAILVAPDDDVLATVEHSAGLVV